jgi:hypothetical protein
MLLAKHEPVSSRLFLWVMQCLLLGISIVVLKRVIVVWCNLSQRYLQTSEIISSLLEYFTVSAAYFRDLSQK